MLAVTIGCIIGWLLFRRLRRREGFQDAASQEGVELIAQDLLPRPAEQQCPARNTNTDQIKAKFWELVGLLRKAEGTPLDELTAENGLAKEGAAVMNVMSVTDPGEADTYQVIFPLYISIYALATYGGGRSDCARADLFERYNELLKGLTETVYDQREVAAWGAQPKEKTCAALKVIEGNFAEAKAQLRARIQDVSGSSLTLADLRDENMEFQQRFEASCKDVLSDACKELASQEPVLFPLLAQFEGVIETNYGKEEDINETLSNVADLYKLLGCQLNVGGGTLVYSADTDTGEIDVETLRAKLQILSPYYLSPDVLKYITDSLISPDDVQDSLMNTSDVFAKVVAHSGSIRRMSGLAA